ncbi:9045_t:CDS:2 [Rhizophagus irregularis]|nr:9045_t:CDS:2 [Rhizophagus irregularis]
MAYQSQVHQQSSTHMMKTTRSGRPFVKDIHDLFSTLVVSLPMETHRNLFRSYSNSFTTEEAIANLGSLKFTQSHRTPDPKDPSHMAKSVCQTFMDARLFENLADSSSRSFKDKNVFGLTPKGLYILERFVTRNGIAAPHLAKLFASQTSPIRLYFVERSPENDSVSSTRQCVESIFRRFAGTKPNIVNKDSDETKDSDSSSGSFCEKHDRNIGIEVKERQFGSKMARYSFNGAAACDWLCDFTTLITKEEAMKMATEFIRYGLIEYISDKNNESKKRSDKIEDNIVQIENGGNLRGMIAHSNTKKLQQILDDSTLCSLFMEFLKAMFCEENLLFLLEVQTFKSRYSTNSDLNGEPQDPREQHDLIVDAFRIYNTFLAPGSPHELNIDGGLRQHMVQHMTSIVSSNRDLAASTEQIGNPVPITCHLYDKIQDTIFRLMATDSVPKFSKTEKYLAHIRNSEGLEDNIPYRQSSSSNNSDKP